MKTRLGVTAFITWHPPKNDVTVGNIKISNGNGAMITKKTTNSSSQQYMPTVSLEYQNLEQGELDLWVLFHAFILGDPWTLLSYMGTIHGIVELLDKPSGSEKDYSDFLNTAYRTEGIKQKMSYQELYKRFTGLTEQQSGMAKNWLLDLKPGDGWSHPEMANYSYWRMVIDYSIVDAIIGEQSPCKGLLECSVCGEVKMPHYHMTAREWHDKRLLEIVGETEKVEQYMKIIWTVRQNIRHVTAHESAYPYERPASELQPGDNEFDIDTVVDSFKTDRHALTALENNMHEVTRILLLDNVLQTKIFPDIRPYMIRSGGMSWDEFIKLVEQKKK